jgi:hypothetical protein
MWEKSSCLLFHASLYNVYGYANKNFLVVLLIINYKVILVVL